jgi:hypothetical protein
MRGRTRSQSNLRSLRGSSPLASGDTAVELLADDVLLPEQCDVLREQTPSERLWMHVLLSALRAVLVARVTRWRHVDADLAWFASESDDLYTFRWVCAILHLEPDAVRRSLTSDIAQPQLQLRTDYGNKTRPSIGKVA